MNRVIVTGGNGFIGRNLVKKLLSCKLDSLALISNSPNIRDKYFADRKSLKDMPLRFYTADIRDKKTISDIFQNEKGDACIHLAAKTSVADSIINPDETMDINVNGTQNVLDACTKSKVDNFIFASSAAVYGDVRELPISENASMAPLSPYGKSKMLAEELVLRYDKLKKIQNTISLRIFNVYGSGNVNQSDVVSKFAARVSKGLPPIICGDGNHTRDFISVHDVSDSILSSIKVMEQSKSKISNNNESNLLAVYNIATGTPTSINELATKMISISDLDVKPIYLEENPDSGVILHSYADVTKAKKGLNFVAKINLDTGLRNMKEQMQ